MKLKLLFSVVFVCTLLTTSYAQINKGSTWIGSNFSYGKIKGKLYPSLPEEELKRTSITPSVGMAIKENLVLGVFAAYVNDYRENDDYLLENKSRSYGGGVFVRRYMPVYKQLYIFGEGRLSFNHTKASGKYDWGTSGNYSYESKGWATSVALTPGIAYGITQNIQLEAGLASLFNISYERAKAFNSGTNAGNPGNSKAKSFNANVNLDKLSSFTLGVRFLLNKKA
ncbi:hypothetical protein GGD38_005136 [Chitinophagaceae bacterium OAS944]|uniref:hypothetical protein n=1 Tax=Niastella sp. OAS944 TaxID=2664089 RepID=UPI0034855641|nr:hypothetical protein [Chitinophagaceae bacterium OAS944]